MIEFKRLTGALGADVHGIDLTQSLSSASFEAIHAGLLEHLVLFFREQKLMTLEQHRALVEPFGEPEPTPFRRPGADAPDDLLILDQYDPTGSEGAHFHADNTFRPDPPMGAILQAHLMPERGGDTCFASMYAAYEALSPRMQTYLDGLEAYHSYAQMMERLSRKSGVKPGLNLTEWPPYKHPVVKRHAETGRKLLFVNYNWTSHIDGLSAEESTTILKYLYEHIKSPEFQVRLRWNVGDVVFWDNRAVQHHAVADYKGRRLIHRISILARPGAEKKLESVA
jgi:taurine dioxygenase